MLLGELYYYNKILDQFVFPVTFDNLQQLELCGLGKLNKEEFSKNSSVLDLRQDIKDKFSKKYQKTLSQENLLTAENFWKTLIDPKKDQSSSKNNRANQTEFQNQLTNWLKLTEGSDQTQEELNQILQEGQLTTKSNDYAIYYGLRVLNCLGSPKKQESIKKLSLPKLPEAEQSTLHTQPQILVIAQPILFAVFQNINCLTISSNSSLVELGKTVANLLDENKEIKLILLQQENRLAPLEKSLQRQFGKQVLISSLFLDISSVLENSTQSDQSTTNTNTGKSRKDLTYFDKLAKQTLGVKL